MALSQRIRNLAQKWLEEDQEPETNREIQALLDADNEAELERRLGTRITFGTAGLRAAMKAGYAFMNALTVTQATQGLAEYIIRQTESHTSARSVVVGYDGRHNSVGFARLTAATFIAKGFHVLWFDRLVHTPLVPFAVRYYKAAAGVMITASHNPKNDNGYKVYWDNGSQIIPPHDQGIAACINAVSGPLNLNAIALENHPSVTMILEDALGSYLKSIESLARNSSSSLPQIKFVYTPMHGVGLPYMQTGARMAGCDLDHFRIVQSQALPDPDFPTVPFPNPEEHGALSLATEQADRDGIALVLANDPDADRFSAAEKLPDGQWHQFTGNQLGVLFASYILESQEAPIAGRRLAMLASTVSSRMLAAMAKKEGFHFQETLTGFKWLGNVGQNLVQSGYDVVFAYEEAIGFMFPSVVWDKDGVAAGTVFIKACQRWSQEQLTPWQKLQTLYQRYGYFEDANTYLISPSPEVTTRVFDAVRTLDIGRRPQTLGSRTIKRWRDLTLGFDTASSDDVPDLPVDPSAQMITCELDQVVFTVRGSGTEPKIKLYIEAKADTSSMAKSLARAILDSLLEEWFKPEENGLRLAGQ